MIAFIKSESTKFLFRLQVETEPPKPEVYVPVPKKAAPAAQAEGGKGEPRRKPVRKEKKLGPNDPCWCGSGKKYKHCHGKIT